MEPTAVPGNVAAAAAAAAVETAAALMAVSPNSALLNYEELGRRGCGLLCLPGERRRNRVIDLLFFLSPPLSLTPFFFFLTRALRQRAN